MTNKELKERLDSAETSSEKKGIIEFQFAERWINNGATLTDEEKQEFKRLLNIESIKLDMHF